MQSQEETFQGNIILTVGCKELRICKKMFLNTL